MIFQEGSDRFIQKSFLALQPTISVKKAIKRMAEARVSCVIVIEKQELVGIFTERDVVRITANTVLLETLTLSEVMTKKVITLKVSETEDIFELSRFFSKNRIRHLPVLNEHNHVVAVITPKSIRDLLKPEYLLRYVRIKEVMSQNVIHCFPTDSILVVTQQMAINRVSCVVISDSRTLYPIGILTERDIVRFHQQNLDFSKVVALVVQKTQSS